MAGNSGGPWGGGGNNGGNRGDDRPRGGNNGGGRRPGDDNQPQIPEIDELMKKGQERLRVLMGGRGGLARYDSRWKRGKEWEAPRCVARTGCWAIAPWCPPGANSANLTSASQRLQLDTPQPMNFFWRGPEFVTVGEPRGAKRVAVQL